MVKFAVFFGFIMILYAKTPLPYDSLAQPLEQNARKIGQLKAEALSTSDVAATGKFCNDVQNTLLMGEDLAATSPKNKGDLNLYLQQLRILSHRQEYIYQLYRKSLNDAIETKDKKRFEHLASIELEPLHQPRIRSEVIAFYQKNFPANSIKNIELLSNEEDLETKSLQYIDEQEEAWEEHLRILKRSEAIKIKKIARTGSRNSVLLIEESDGHGGYILEAENLNPYTVTMSIDVANLKNLTSDYNLPLFVEISGESKRMVLHLSRVDATKETQYKDAYGWVMGSARAKHRDDYIYQLPFMKNRIVDVTQGYNGGFSHKGLSAYAIDFGVPVGTPILAAREGKVVETETSSSLGGPSPKYRPYMNRIRVEHSDGTFGNYCHLKLNGSAVKLGQMVKKGDLLGYSGSTGYCTAPHLHFSVSKVDPMSMRRPMNLPVKIQTLQGIVIYPHQGERYTAQ
ncbi:MAG: M23 family metallopeptidase [Sulfuricurvum sp.]